MNSERRRSNRFKVVNLDLILQDSANQIGKVINISDGGLLAVLDTQLKEDAIYNFRIPFAETVNGEVNFDFDANVIWCSTNTLEISKYSAGMNFTNNALIQSKFIQQMAKIFSN